MQTDAHVPGDWWRSSSIKGVEEFEEDLIMLEQAIKALELTWNRSATVRCSCGVFEPIWGKLEIGAHW
jgi:glutamine synthetase